MGAGDVDCIGNVSVNGVCPMGGVYRFGVADHMRLRGSSYGHIQTSKLKYVKICIVPNVRIISRML